MCSKCSCQPPSLGRFRGITHIFIDCDDCLYQNGWATARRITQSIGAYTATLGVSKALPAARLRCKHCT